MKKLVAVALAVVLALTMVVVIGCGADTSEAKEIMAKADGYYKDAQEVGDVLEALQASVLGAILQGQTPDVTPEEVETVPTLISEVLSNVAAAEAEYQSMSTLSGVDDYVEYAEQMILACNIYTELMEAAGGLTEKLAPLLTQMFAGEEVDLQSLLSQEATTLETITGLQTKLETAEKNAAKIKQEKKLAE